MTLDPAAILREFEIEASILEGARNALSSCLGVARDERVVLFVEEGCDMLAASFLQEAEALGADVEVHIVDARKALHEPFVKAMTEQLAHADVSLFVGTLEGVPSSFRRAVILAKSDRRRHGHMPGLTAAMMQQSMRSDYAEVKALGARLLEKLGAGATIGVRSPRGTSLIVRCGTSARWHDENGVLRTPGWTNLPAGELLTAPDSVEGVLVPDGGAWDGLGEVVKNADRLKLTFDGGRVTNIEGGAGTEPERLLAQLDAHKHGRRVGQVAFGTNIGVVAAIGNLLQDLKMPGIHLCLGHPTPERTGADWDCAVEVPLLVRRADVDVDGTPVLRAGRYVAPFAK